MEASCTRVMVQPWLGLVSFLITAVVALVVSAMFSSATFVSWVALFSVAAVPAEAIWALGFQFASPPWFTRLSQPAKGAVTFLVLALYAAILTPLMLLAIDGGIHQPTPFVIMFAITTVPVALWLVIVFGMWPFSAVAKNKTVQGLATLVLTYVLSWIVFQVVYDFGFAAKAPFYEAPLDPQGLVGAWQGLVFVVTSAAAILLLVLFDFWPITTAIAKAPALAKQPVHGLLSGTLIVIVTVITYGSGVGLGAMDPVMFMLRVPVSFLFGTFVALSLLQTWPVQGLRQPSKGVVLVAVSAVSALVLQIAYAAFAKLIHPGIASGAPGYDLQLWVATAMLGVTFPLIILFCDALERWPLVRRQDPTIG